MAADYPRAPAGTVTVPAGHAGDLMRYLVRSLARDQRDDAGGSVAPWMVELLQNCSAADQVSASAPISGASEKLDETGEGSCLTVAEAAALSGWSVQTIRRRAAAGKLRARHHGRDWVIERSQFFKN